MRKLGLLPSLSRNLLLQFSIRRTGGIPIAINRTNRNGDRRHDDRPVWSDRFGGWRFLSSEPRDRICAQWAYGYGQICWRHFHSLPMSDPMVPATEGRASNGAGVTVSFRWSGNPVSRYCEFSLARTIDLPYDRGTIAREKWWRYKYLAANVAHEIRVGIWKNTAANETGNTSTCFLLILLFSLTIDVIKNRS